MPSGRLERSALRRLDAAGLLLFAAAIGWTYAAGGSTDTAHRTAGVFAAAGAATVAGRAVGRFAGWLVPLLIAGVAAVLWAMAPAGIMSHEPLSGPFGYSNAKGAFFMMAAGCVMAAAAFPRRPIAVAIGVVAATPFIVVPFASQTRAPALLIVIVPILALILHAVASPRTAVEICGVLVAVALLTTALLGAAYRPAGGTTVLERFVGASLDRRVIQWHEAGSMMGERPLRGVGVGRFEELSPTARRDPDDARWAHNAFLQYGAETGVIGLGLLVGIFVWAFLRLALGAPEIRQTLVAAVLAAIGIHATLDYVLHFPAIPVAAAALVGSATARRHRMTDDAGIEATT